VRWRSMTFAAFRASGSVEDRIPSHFDRRVSIQPLLAEHCEESGEERNSEIHEEDCLNLDNRVWGPVHCGRAGTSLPKVVLSIL